MNGYILGLGTAVPVHPISQQHAMENMLDLFSFDHTQQKTIRHLYEHSCIEKRHLILGDFTQPKVDRKFWTSEYPTTVPGMAQRNAVYKAEAPKLSEKAAKKAFESWGGDPATITHIISVSCTGVVVPGIEFSLIDLLGLSRNCYRLGINMMGCFGAFKGLEVANAFAKANSKNRILVVCTELCSLHLQTTLDSDTLVANSIFADGAAAVVVGGEPKDKEIPLWEMVDHFSVALENSTEQMSWEAGDHGFFMKLSKFVPVSISKYIQAFSKSLLDNRVSVEECDWAIHPGGKAIVQVVEKKLKLQPWQTKHSWNVLKNYGNMSSATFLFVLESLNNQGSHCKEWTAGVGFGPGLSVEGVLLKRT